MNRGLVFYDQSADQIEFYHAPRGQLALLGTLGPEGRQWSHLVAGPYYNTNFSGILLYERNTGDSRFYMPNFNGRTFTLGFRTDHSGWRTNWTQIIGGHFGGVASEPGSPADLLFYDAATGTGEFYRTAEVLKDGILRIELRVLRTHTGWRGSWTQIVPGQFGGDGITDLLFYEAATGTGVFYTVDSQGRMRELAVHNGWRTSWAQIIPGNFGGNSRTDLLFYDPGAHTGEFYATDQGQLQRLATHTDWRATWNVIVPGDFAGTSRTSLLFYDAAAGTGEFYDTDAGRIGLVSHNPGWRKTWSHIWAFDSEIRSGGEL